jgi:hypothetical protein
MTAVGTVIHGQVDRAPLSAGEVRELCFAGEDPTITRRRIVGRLDLAGAHLRNSVRFVDCEFDDCIDLRDARAEETIEWVGGHLVSLMADRLESRQHVTLTDASSGAVSFRQAHIGGDLRLTNSSLRMPQGTALEAADLRVDGSLFLDGDGRSSRTEAGIRAEGEVCLASADINGSVDCRHSTFDHASGKSINGFEMSVGVELVFEEGFVANGEVCLERATVDRLRAGGGTFRKGSGRWALHADSLSVKTGIYLDHGFSASGEVRLTEADVTGQLSCTGGTFDNRGGVAFDATRLRAEDVYLDRGFRADGEVSLRGAHITRQLTCTAGQFANEDGFALDGDGLQCDGEVFLDRGFSAKGEVRLLGAQITNELNCTGGRFTNLAGQALNADGLTTPGNVYLNSESAERAFRAQGELRLARATVGRQLKLSGAVLSNAGEQPLDLSGLIGRGDVLLDGCHCTGPVRMRGATIDRDLTFKDARLKDGLDAAGVTVGGTFTWRLADTPQGDVDLSFATVGTFDDTLTNWPAGGVILAGFRCRTPAENQITARQWIAWLGSTRRHYADAYEQLAHAYRLGGDETAATELSIARQRDLRRKHRGHLSRPAWLWNWLLDKSTSYGYHLHRPLGLILIMAGIGTVVFVLANRSGLMEWVGGASTVDGRSIQLPSFQPFIYSVQTLIPGLDLQETSRWLPRTDEPWGMAVMVYLWIAVTVGWLASGALIAGVGRFFRQQS